MKIDFQQPIYELDGTPATTGGQKCPTCGQTVGGKPEPLTLATVVARALVRDSQQSISDMDKAKRGLLALRVFDADEPLDVSVEEISAIKAHIDVLWPPITVAQAGELLEGRKNPFAR